MRHHTLLLALLLGTLALCAGLVGCDSANPVAPSGSTITVTANPTLIGLNESSTITVTGFKPDGNPLNPGSQINLSTDLGVLDATIISIDGNGRAATVLRADGRPGPATVTATLPAGEATATATVEIGEMSIQPTLAITASPNRINIEQESNISVIARNVDGTFLSGGRVRLRTSLGSLDEESLVTAANGEAETVLRPDGRSGAADVTGSVDSGMDAMSAMVTIIQTQLNMTANPTIIDINDLDGDSQTAMINTSVITVQARDEDSIPLVNGHDVQLTSSLGLMLSGLVDPVSDRDIDQASSTVTVTTDGEGIATVTYIAGQRAGTDTVEAFFGNAMTASANINLLAAPASLTLTADKQRIAPQTDDVITLTAVVTDAEGLLLSNEVVSFAIETPNISGTFLPGRTDTTDANGTATVTLNFESATAPSLDQDFVISASARGGVSDTVDIEVR